MREAIKATDGHILTDGTIYGKVIYLGQGVDASAFHEITVEEYNAIMTQEQDYEGITSPDDATEADCQAALEEFGVQM